MDSLSTRLYEGDEKALTQLRDELSKKLHVFAISYVRCDFTAEDLVQDTFIKLWESRQDIIKYSNIGSFIYTILRNKCLDYLKHKTIELKYSQQTSSEYLYLQANMYALEDESINIITDAQISKALSEAVKKLPHHSKVVFIMSRYNGLRNSEIAEELSISVKTVEYHMTRAISFLKKEMEKYFIFLFL
jgi:RNA polymerase sigma-70 factor, ECF subfamily